MDYPKSYLVIDIGNERIKIADLSGKKDKVIINQFTILETPKNVMSDGFILDKTLLANLINQALLDENFKSKSLVFTITSSKMITREVEFPKLKTKKLETVIKMNAEDYFPVDLDQYILDYMITDTVVVNEESILKVDLIAAQKVLIDEYVELSELLGLKLIGIDYAGNSLTNFIKKEKLEGNYMVLDIGSESTMVSIMKDGVLKFNRNILSGTGFIIEYLTKELNIRRSEAIKMSTEKLLLKYEQGEGEVEPDIAHGNDLNTNMDLMLYNISRVLDYYTSRNQDKIEGIYIVGGGSRIYKIEEYIGQYFNLKTKKLNNFKSVDAKVIQGFLAVEMYFTNIIGSAFSEINLIPVHLSNRDEINTKKRTYFLLMILAIVSLTATFIFMQGQNLVLSNKKATLEENISQAKEVQKIKLEFDRVQNKIKFREEILESSKTKSEELVQVLEMMESKMPTDVFYLNMSDTGTSIEISCIAQDKITVAKFIETLKNMGLFSEVYVPNLTESDMENEENSYISFSVSCKY